MAIRYLDMFAGIGGFRSGLERLGGFECIGFCEIDKYAKKSYEAMYDTKGELYFNDARKIKPEELPDIDLITGGFPCQSFSIAGQRKGFEDTRGTLFFEIARIAAVKKPKYLFLENVPGLLSHDRGRTFKTILSALDELGYDVTWQVLNSKDFGVPQSRKRLYIVGFLRSRCAGQILSFKEANSKTTVQIFPGKEGDRIYSSEGESVTLTCNAGGFGGRSGLYSIEEFAIPIKVKTKSGYQIAYPGDSIDIGYSGTNTRRGRVGHEVAHTLTTSLTQAYYFIDMNADPKMTEVARCITARHASDISNRKGEHSAVFLEKFQITDEEEYPVVVFIDKNCKIHIGKIRKLTPRESWRLQGFTDQQFDKVIKAEMSDTQLYKQAGNAVTVNVISAVGQIIKDVEGDK
jgi:DNA (cytosine-5)-methyltransferase 1